MSIHVPHKVAHETMKLAVPAVSGIGGTVSTGLTTAAGAVGTHSAIGTALTAVAAVNPVVLGVGAIILLGAAITKASGEW